MELSFNKWCCFMFLLFCGASYMVIIKCFPESTINIQINFNSKTQHRALSTNNQTPSTDNQTPSTSASTSSVEHSEQASEESHVIKQRILKERMRKMCTLYNLTTPPLPRLLVGNEKYRILYASNPKCGSTSFKKYILRLSGSMLDYQDMRDVHDVNRPEYNTLEDLVEKTGLSEEAIISSYHKIGFVRNPLVRIVSAYRDKIERDNGEMLPHLRRILKNIDDRKNRFEKFIQMLVTRQFRNEHTNPYWSTMSLCSFNYDMLLQVETINEQIPALQNLLGSQNYTFPLSRVGLGVDVAGSDKVLDYVGSKLDNELLERFYEYYKYDFLLTGYSKLGEEEFPYLKVEPR